MITQAQIKHIRSLQQKKFRNEFNQFVAEGPKLVEEFISSKYTFDCIYATKEWFEIHQEDLQKRNIPFEEIKNNELERISGFTTPNQVLAVLNIPVVPIPDDIIGKDLVLILDGINDPGNLGAMIRTADWFGIDHIICSETTVDAHNPKVVQATMGSLARVNIYYTNLHAWLEENKQKAKIYGAFMEGECIYDMAPEKNGMIVIGNESKGISEDIQPYIHHRVSIPMQDNKQDKSPESLNASIAAAIICYEFRKKSKS
jgi:RNA methyltransferase, TrmH family